MKPAEIHTQLVAVYCVNVMDGRKWCEMFRNGRTNANDEKRSGRRSIITNHAKKRVDGESKKDCKVTIRDLELIFLDVSRAVLGQIVHEHI